MSSSSPYSSFLTRWSKSTQGCCPEVIFHSCYFIASQILSTYLWNISWRIYLTTVLTSFESELSCLSPHHFYIWREYLFPCVTRPSHSLAQKPTWPSTHLKNDHNSCVDKHGSIWAVTGFFFSCISVPIPIHQCSCFTGFPLVSHTVPTDRECF